MEWKKTIVQLVCFLGLVVAVSGVNTLPAVVILSGSMEPRIQRGDLMITHRPIWGDPEYRVGDVVIFKLEPQHGFPTQEIPIIHRVIRSTENCLWTQGDANRVDDTMIFRRYGHACLSPDNVLAKAYDCPIPFLGYVTLYRWYVLSALVLYVLYEWKWNTDQE